MTQTHPEQQQNPEQRAEKPRVTKANEVIAAAAEQHPATDENFKVLDTYVDDLLQSADKGEITGSAGTYTRERILDQFEDFLKEYKHTRIYKPAPGEAPKDPFTFIPSKDGLRDAFRLMMKDHATAHSLEQSLKLHVEAHLEKRAELLSPEKIEEMGEAELTAAEVPEPMEQAKVAAAGLIEMPDHIRWPHGKPSEAGAPAPVDKPQVTEQLQTTEAAAPQPESDAEMYDRFVREDQAELQQLYAEHRAAQPGSWEQGSLENQISNKKKDIGDNLRKAARARGDTKWH